MIEKGCANCGQSLDCSADDTCWCMGYPPILSIQSQSCWCATCLAKSMSQQINIQLDKLSLEESINFAQSFANESVEHIDYRVEEGLYVFTRWSHLKRGYCCGNGCRECPYK